MWEIGSRGVVGLLSVFAGLVILYNAWGPILVLAILLFLVVNTCYSLLVNDSLVSPHNLVAFEYVKGAASELNVILERVSVLVSRYIRDLANATKRYYRQRINSNMNRPRRSSFRLSSDSFVKARDPSSYTNSNVNQLSPIPRRNFQQVNEWNDGDRFAIGNESVIKHTSTPLVPWKKENLMNGEPGEPQQVLLQRSSTKISPLQGQNHTLSRGEETMFSPEGSPWGTSISPKMRSKAAGVKTVQTVAGPLLASTRYNIDTKVYSDATSPGLTTRLSKYASEIGNKLLHQSQYGMGHFPKVNLNASPTPLINTKAAKMRMPVTVRIAQPDAMRYSSSERHKMLNTACHPENKSPNVVQALREISLKRHASRDDVTSDLVKKQRTDGIYSEELETLEEMTQKRARDESLKSDDETSPSQIDSRPLKRSKAQSCNDILNSLSSSMHVLSGVKRKATDISRSSTPDFEKHFKPLDKSQDDNFSTFPLQNETPKSTQRFTSDPLPIINVPLNPEQKPKPWSKVSPKESFSPTVEDQVPRKENKSSDNLVIQRPQVLQRAQGPRSPVKLADKLFMRAEPQNNEKLRTLIEEQGNVKDKFSITDKDEIKKKDIVNMRQTSMKARLQSMFDAISGKGANKINPDVVIQAEEAKDTVSSVASAVLTTLSSSTSTTNVNTSPITSPVVPILKTASNKKTPTKHVSFSIPSGVSTATSASSILTTENVSSKTEDITKTAPTSVGLSVSSASIGNTIAPTFSFGTTSTAPTSAIQGSFNVSTSVVTSEIKSPIASSTLAPKTTTPLIPTSSFTSTNTPKSLITTPGSSTSSFITQNLNTTQSSNTSQSLNTTQSVTTTSSSGFTFGVIAKSPTSTSLPTFGQSTSVDKKTPSSTSASIPSGTVVTSTFSLTTSTTPAAAPTFTFGASKPISQPSTEQTIPKTQTLPPFGSVSASFSFPGNATTVSSSSNLKPAETSSSEFKAPNTKPTFSFGSAPSTTKSFSFGASAATTTSAPVFGASNASLTFGASTNSAQNSATNPVSNLPTTSPPTFGASANTTPNFASSASSSFGAVNNSTINFGSANTSEVKSFGTPATTASMFGSSATVTTSSVFGSTNTPSIFGNTSSGTASAFGTPKTTASIFGNTSSGTASTFGTPTSAPSLFSNNNATLTTSSTLPTFGAPVTTSNVFNQGNASANPPPPAYGASTTSSGLFSSTNATSTTSSNSTIGGSSNIFSQAKPPPAFGAASPTFGSTGTSVFGTTSANSAGFNATNQQTNPPPAYGSMNTAVPIFGAQQNSGTAATAAQNSSFGFGTTTSNTPSFGSTSTTTTGFGTATNSSFPAQSNSGISFGTGNSNPPAFGSTTPAFGSQSSTNVFGSTVTSPPAFGATASNSSGGNNNANVGGTFTFGAGGNQAQTQPTPTFSFGATGTNNNNNNNNNNNSAAGAPFQFGSAASKPATGFNFNAPSATPNINFGTTAPPAFNAPAPGTSNFAAPAGGMFSIGTGSTAPRSRTTRSRRQR